MKSLNAYAFLRISMGIAIALHGLMKALAGPSFWKKLGSMPPMIPDVEFLHYLLGTLAMLIELVGGILIAIGIKVRISSIAVVAVLLAAFAYHAESIKGFESLMRNSWPLELALVFCAIALMQKKN